MSDDEGGFTMYRDEDDGGDSGQDFGGESKFMATYDDTQRANIVDECGGTADFVMPSKGGMAQLSKEINVAVRDPVERFKRHIGAISNSITQKDLYDISIDDRNKMCQTASTLSNAKYLNATAFILGYIVTNGGRKINKNTVEIVFDFLDELTDDSVKQADVIRYARLWNSLNT